MSAIAAVLAALALAAFLGALISAWMEAVAMLRAQGGWMPGLLDVLSGATALLLGMGGAAVGVLVLGVALEGVG